ncbi:MAG: endopeptidase La [Clostridia bacterium]|nr:endopeptidase La [Clostridia bacterium]MBQ9041170.1 endopeptidase La [Clostridia bacterium]
MSVMPLYNIIALPGAKLWLQTRIYKELTGKAPVEGERVTLLMQKDEQPRAGLDGDSFRPIGVTGAISEVSTNGFVCVDIQNRVNIEEVAVLRDRSFSMTVSRRADVDDLDPADAARRLTGVKDRILSFARGKQWEGMLRGFAAHWDSLWTVAAAMSPWLSAPAEERYALLAEDSLSARFDALEQMLLEGLELADVQSAAQSAQQEDHEKLYRESAIKKQIEYLQKELDALHPENVSELRRLELKLEEAGMNETALKEGRKVLNRIKGEGANSPEAGMLTDWLDLLTSLPWKKAEAKDISMDEARAALNAGHSGLDKVKKRILQQLAVMRLKGRQSGSILCFVGAPGTGKTSIGERIAQALGREYVRVSLGGVRDEADIRGHRRTYIGAMPGRIIDGIHKCGANNPVMVLDEVDKLSQSYNGDPSSALLEVLDPEQNFSFTDHYLNVPFDLSDVLFICTANTLDTIPEPLLNRMEVIRFQGYTPIEKREIARKHLLPRAMAEVGIPDGALTVSDEAIEAVIENYTREAGVRGLKKRMDQLCRSAAVAMVDDPKAKLSVTGDNLSAYMDMNPVRRKRVPGDARPGIVTGLAWTPVGGDILYIQSLLTHGSGQLTVTGQLGDVMKESARIAVSLVKAMLPQQAQALAESDLHIHVPDGATPKDGPSAGITLTTALASLLTGVAVPPSVAMTGEVSLQGDVNPIGGLPEKLMAAQRSGVKRVFIPRDNLDDLKDVADEVKRALEIVPVNTVTEVLLALGMPVEAGMPKAM